jgi:hypothetical protein
LKAACRSAAQGEATRSERKKNSCRQEGRFFTPQRFLAPERDSVTSFHETGCAK